MKRVLSAILVSVAALSIASCPSAVQGPKAGSTGKVSFTLEGQGLVLASPAKTLAAGARTVIPTIAPDEYRISVGSQTFTPTVPAPGAAVSLDIPVGTWTAAVEARNGGTVVARGTSGSFTVAEGSVSNVAVRLSPLGEGQGSVGIDISWSADVPGVAALTATWDENSIPSGFDVNLAARTASFSADPVSAGNHRLALSFRNGAGVEIAYVEEDVQVGGNASSAGRIELVAADFNAPPEAPVDLVATKAANGVQLSWTDASKTEKGFRVQRRRAPSGSWTQAGSDLAPGSAAYLDSPLPPAGDYEYRVEAFNDFGSAFSIPAAITISATTHRYVADHEVATLEILRSIPVAFTENARDSLRVAYFHTSHGTHVSYGVFGLPDFSGYPEFKTRFAVSTTKKAGALYFQDFAFDSSGPMRPYQDLSRADSNWPDWTEKMRSFLETNTDINVVMWSWCDIVGHDVDAYLASMETLIGEYGQGGAKIGTGSGKTRLDPVDFVFMTGHARLSSQPSNIGDGMPYPQAKKIVEHCREKGRYCIDYYAIDTHDMDGAYWDDTTDECASAKYNAATPGTSSNFYRDYQNSTAEGISWYQNRSSPGGTFALGQHTNQHITSNRKAFAFWWILARIAGWDGAAP